MMSEGLVYTNANCVGCNKCINACSCMGAYICFDRSRVQGKLSQGV